MKTLDVYMRILQDKINESGMVSMEIYHNTVLMLKLYRKVLSVVSRRMNYLEDEIYESENKHLYNLVNSLVDLDGDFRQKRFEERMMSIEESTSLLALMEKALILLKEESDKGEKQYDILYYYYFEKNKNTNEEIMELVDLPNTTYYRYKRRALRNFAVNLWGYIIPEICGRVLV